ncbi:hypothetical protein RCL1_008123 [Eukaryota sp. TZLM3-RCL]
MTLSSLLQSQDRYINVTTVLGDTFSGFVHCIDDQNSTLVLFNNNPTNVHIINTQQISSHSIEADKRSPFTLPSNFNFNSALESAKIREERAVEAAEKEQQHREALSSLSPAGQDVYNHFSKQYTLSIQRKSILVVDYGIEITPEYKRARQQAGKTADTQALNRFISQLIAFWNKKKAVVK